MDGILPLWKPRGMTSHDCVSKIRKLLKIKKVGHTGTLDPEVDGVLPLCIGKATKIAEYITNSGKMYEGEVTLGVATTTEDAYGEMIDQKDVGEGIALINIQNVLESFKGEIIQTPPMYSAVKVKGKKLYEYARQGIEVERPSRKVNIYSIRLLTDEIIIKDGKQTFRFEVHCSKGTYIRTLAVMIGEKLGFPAHMSALTRIASATFTKEDCVTFEQIEEHMKKGKNIQELLKPLESGISNLPSWHIDSNLLLKIKNGAVLPKPDQWPKGHVVMLYNNKAYAIYQEHLQKSHLIKPVKVIRNA